MAVAFTTQHTRTSEYLFDPKELVIKPELNGRHEEPDIEALIADIVRNGQLEPVIVRNDGGHAVLSAGFSRWRAITTINEQKLTPTPLPIRAIYRKANELDGFLANISENRYRNQTTKLDDAYNVRRLEQWGQTETQIAEVYREDVKWVRKMLKLVELDPVAQQAVANGQIPGTAISAVAKLTTEQQRKVVGAAGNGKVKLPSNGHGPAVAKFKVRYKVLTEIEKTVSNWEVFNRDKVLGFLKEQITKVEQEINSDK